MFVRSSINSIFREPVSGGRSSRTARLHPLRSTLVLTCMSLLVVASSIGCASSRSGGDGAEPGTVQIALGSDGAEATSTELTLDALRAGQSVYSIQGAQGTYTVDLTEEQVADLVSGSTVMTEATGENGTEQVRISVAKASKKGFGW